MRFVVTCKTTTTRTRRPFPFGPWSSTTQLRWKKRPVSTAQTRFETRTLDPKLDRLTTLHRILNHILDLHTHLSTRKRGSYISLQTLSTTKLLPHPSTAFVKKYPHVFQVFTSHAVPCLKFTPKFMTLIDQENELTCQQGYLNNLKLKVKRLLLMSVNGSIHIHAIRLIRKELGLPDNFRELIILNNDRDFRLVNNLEVVELVKNDDVECVAEVEKWRENEYKEKWLSEYEVKYAFPVNFPTGFRVIAGFKEKLRNWQRMAYIKPYERIEEGVKMRAKTCGGPERYEKRAVGIIHELLCLTVDKMVPLERLAHFRKDLGFEVNVREVLLKHPGIFYVSTRGSLQMVFLREAYLKGCLVIGDDDPVYGVRKRMLELIVLGCRNTKDLTDQESEVEDEKNGVGSDESDEKDELGGDFVIPILESIDNQSRCLN